MTANFIHRVASNYEAEWNNNPKMVRIRPKAVSNLPESCYPEMLLAKNLTNMDIIILVTIEPRFELDRFQDTYYTFIFHRSYEIRSWRLRKILLISKNSEFSEMLIQGSSGTDNPETVRLTYVVSKICLKSCLICANSGMGRMQSRLWIPASISFLRTRLLLKIYWI